MVLRYNDTHTSQRGTIHFDIQSAEHSISIQNFPSMGLDDMDNFQKKKQDGS